jgi:Domain of unknown function (DUF6259)
MRVASILVLAATLVASAAHAAGSRRTPAISFSVSKTGRLQVTAPGYRLALDRETGRIVDLVARPSGTRLVRGEAGCLWSAKTAAGTDVDACAASPIYSWKQRSATLTLAYPTSTVAITAGRASLDLALTVENGSDSVLQSVDFPADLLEASATVKAGYVPTYLPGLRLKQDFFWGSGEAVWTYPSRWAFADYLAFDAGASSLALYSVNPAPNPIRPVDLGFVRAEAPDDCSGPTFCVRHRFQTWVEAGKSWTSPPVRLQVGQTAEQSILGYRADNGIDAYPSLATKTAASFDALVRAPLIKADLRKGVPFAQWGAELARLPSPALVHPVSFQPGAFDTTDPDFLPPDPALGTNADFRAAVQQAHSHGDLVMPYLNASWWSVGSPTIAALAGSLGADDISVQNRLGQAHLEGYSDRRGYVVSPYAPFVRTRFRALLDEWTTDVPADCLFFDQIGARPWLRDFNPAAPTPLSYEDGWLALLAPASTRCLMVEDGWDRLASVSAGFLGGLLLMEREFQEPDFVYGRGNWEPYPLALWLLHDKVLLYQHDLYEQTMTADPEALAWNLAFGFMLSYDWNATTDSLASPWLDVAASFQHALGRFYAGRQLTSFATVAPGVTRTSFGDYSVVTNWSATDPYDTSQDELAPGGFVARTADGSVRAGAFSGFFAGSPLSAGTHYLVEERTATSVTVHQPLGDATELSVDLPSSWTPGTALTATASTGGGAPVDVAGRIQGRRFLFRCLGPADGTPAPTYVIGAGSQ